MSVCNHGHPRACNECDREYAEVLMKHKKYFFKKKSKTSKRSRAVSPVKNKENK